MKYKIGDKVRVKDNLEVGKMYFMSNMAEFDSVEREMLKFKGKEVTISSYTDSKKYCIKEDDEKWCWTDAMFYGLTTSRTVSDMEWVNVKDDLPKKKCDCLCCYHFRNLPYKYAGVLTYYPHLERFEHEDEDMGLQVTHWMLLPSLPEEG